MEGRVFKFGKMHYFAMAILLIVSGILFFIYQNSTYFSSAAKLGQKICISKKGVSNFCFVLNEFDAYQNSVFSEYNGNGALVIDIIPENGSIYAQLTKETVLEKTKNNTNSGLLAFRIIKTNDDEYAFKNVGDEKSVTTKVDAATVIGKTNIDYGYATLRVKDQSVFLIEGKGKSTISIALILRSKFRDVNEISVFGVSYLKPAM